MSRVKSNARLEADQNGSRRRQGKHVVCRSSGIIRQKTVNQTKKRKRDDTSPEKD